MSENLARFVLFFPVFLFSLSFHECAHAFVANRLGDPTARMLGRMTLNPFPHIDIIGTVVFPLMMFLMPGLMLFGWAKPVPVNARYLRRRGEFYVAAAGPVSNLLLALLFVGIIRLSLGSDLFPLPILTQMFEIGVFLNLMLAIFNLVPIYPLDGEKVLEGILPTRYLSVFDRIKPYGMWILMAAFITGVFRYLTIPVYRIAGWMLP